MTLKAVVENIEQVDEAFRGLYKEDQNGLHVLNVEPVNGFALENITSLKNALEKERADRKKFEGLYKPFEGIEADAARDALAKAEKWKDFDPEKDAERIALEKFNNAKKQLESEFETRYNPVAEENASLRSLIVGAALENAANEAIAAAKGNPALLMPIIKSMTKAEYQDGKVVISVLDEGGKPKIKDHVNQTPYSVSDLIEELKSNEAYGGAFEAHTGGSGATVRPVGAPPTSKPDMGGSREQRLAAIRQRFKKNK